MRNFNLSLLVVNLIFIYFIICKLFGIVAVGNQTIDIGLWIFVAALFTANAIIHEIRENKNG